MLCTECSDRHLQLKMIDSNIPILYVLMIDKEIRQGLHWFKKKKPIKIVDRLPSNATWDDLMHEIYVHESIEQGLAVSQSGRTKSVQEIRAKYSLPE